VRGVAPRGAVVRLSPLWVSTPVGENLIEKGHDPWEAQQVEHSAAGVSMSPQGHQKVWVRSLCEGTEGDKEWVPLPPSAGARLPYGRLAQSRAASEALRRLIVSP
jgi:hypothetical protein